MHELSQYLGFISVSLLVALSPGPSWVYSISTTLGHGRKAGMIGNLGNSTGILCHALAVALGLAALLQYSSTAFQALKFFGAAYLVYLALQSLRGHTALQAQAGSGPTSLRRIFRNGAFVSIFNPKISLLMLALLPQFVDPSGIRPQLQIALMGAIHALVAALVHTHVVFFSGAIASRMRASNRLQRLLRWTTGSLFLGFGIRLALSEQR